MFEVDSFASRQQSETQTSEVLRVAGQRPVEKPQGNGQTPWRFGYNEVAPIAQQIPGLSDVKPPQGGNGAPPWRAQPVPAPIVPGAPPRGGDVRPAPVGPGGNGPSPFGGGAVRPGDAPPAPVPPAAQPEVIPPQVVQGGQGQGGQAGERNWLDWVRQQGADRLPEGFRPAPPGGGQLNPMAAGPVPEYQRALIEKSGKLLTNVPGFIWTGGLTGIGVNATVYGLDAKLLNTPVDQRGGFLKWYESFSPAHARMGSVVQEYKVAQGELAQAIAVRTQTAADLALVERTSTSLVGALETQLPGLTAGAADHTLATAQVEFLKAGKAANADLLKSAVGTAEEVAAGGGKLFVTGSKEANDLLLFAERSMKNAEAVSAATTAETTAATKKAALDLASREGASATHGSLLGHSVRGMAKGMAVSAGTLAIGYGVDTLAGKALGYQPSQDCTGRFLLDGVAVPGILLSNMEGRYKIPLALSTFAMARAGDWWYGSGGSMETSMLLRPNTVDAVGITAASLLPIPGKYKALGILGTVAAGRGWNMIARATGLAGEPAIEVRDNVRFLSNTDLSTRTEASFTKTAERARSLGNENPAMLELELVDMTRKTGLHKIDYNRAVGALSFGLGMSRLELGSRLTPTDVDMRNRFLVGTNYDLGGDATMELRRAAGCLIEARDYAVGHKGEVLSNGQKLDEAYVQQMNKLLQEVEKKLDLVYGEHKDFESTVYDGVKTRCRTNIQDITAFIVNHSQFLATLKTSDKRYVSKVNRDLALVNIAYADYISSANNGEDAARFFNAGMNHIAEAEKLDGATKSKDIVELRRIADRVRTKIPGALGNQWNNNFNNPMQLRPTR